MSGQFWLTHEQVEQLRPRRPKARGKSRVDDGRVPSGILHVHRNGLRWQEAPGIYGPPNTLYYRFVRWLRLGVFARVFRDVAKPGPDAGTLTMDAEPVVRHRSENRRRRHLKARRTAASLRKGGSARAPSAAQGVA